MLNRSPESDFKLTSYNVHVMSYMRVSQLTCHRTCNLSVITMTFLVIIHNNFFYNCYGVSRFHVISGKL